MAGVFIPSWGLWFEAEMSSCPTPRDQWERFIFTSQQFMTSFHSLVLLKQTFLIFLRGNVLSKPLLRFAVWLWNLQFVSVLSRARKSKPVTCCVVHPTPRISSAFFLEQYRTVDSYSAHGSHPGLAFCSTVPWLLIPPFSLCAFDLLLLSVALCTFLYWVVDFLQFTKIILNSQSIRQTVCILSQLDDVCRFYEYSLFPRHRLLMKILHKMDSTQMLEGPRLKLPLSLTENSWQLGFKAIFFPPAMRLLYEDLI